MEKSIFSSKTFWLATIQAAIGVVVVFSTAYPEAGYLVIGKSILVILLRVITETKVTV